MTVKLSQRQKLLTLFPIRIISITSSHRLSYRPPPCTNDPCLDVQHTFILRHVFRHFVLFHINPEEGLLWFDVGFPPDVFILDVVLLIASITYTVCPVRSQCDMAVGTKLFFDMMHDKPPKIMLFGDACSHVTAPIAESSVWWNIWQVLMHLKPPTTVTVNPAFGLSLANVGERNYSCLMTEDRC